MQFSLAVWRAPWAQTKGINVISFDGDRYTEAAARYFHGKDPAHSVTDDTTGVPIPTLMLILSQYHTHPTWYTKSAVRFAGSLQVATIKW